MIWWYFSSLVIFCHIFGTHGQYFTVERYSVLATIPFVFILNRLIEYLPYSATIYIVVCCTYFWWSHYYIKAWRTNDTLFGYSMESQPATSENYNNYGLYLLEKGGYNQACRVFLVAEQLTYGDKFRIYLNLARCFGHPSVADYGKALEYATKALGCTSCPIDQREKVIELRDGYWNKIETIKSHRKKLKRLGITN
jgi:hypothetical protein